MKKKKFRYQLGACLMFFLYGGFFFVLLARLFYIQFTGQAEGVELAKEAAARYEASSELAASRGQILDRQDNIIAEDVLNYRLIAVVREAATRDPRYPEHVVDPAETARVLAQYIALTEEQIYTILTREGDPYQVEFGTPGANISHTVRSQILEHELPGIRFEENIKRYYPSTTFAPYVVGFTLPEKQEDGTYEQVGKMGIELQYNKVLAGVDGSLNYQRDRKGYLLPNSTKQIQPAQDGATIHTTLDKTIQSFLEEALTRAYDAYNPESIVAIVANPKTGEILAMSQRPTFNLATRAGLDNWLNLAVEEVIEPGSTMKTFTLAASIDSNSWRPDDYYSSGSYLVSQTRIYDHYRNGWGYISYLEGFQRSSNTAMANMLDQMGHDTFVSYLEKFGFGQKTGVELPNEATGTNLTRAAINRVTTAYGQGSTVTPLQLIQAASAVANDGKMMQPYIVEKVVDTATDKVIEEHGPVVKGEPITASTAAQVREILASTVTAKYGTASAFQIDGYDVAGKTGTAQIPPAYSLNRDDLLYSFLGMAPVEDPQLVMYVAVKRPKLADGESTTQPTSEIFNTVMEKSLKYLNIAPSDATPIEQTVLADYTNVTAETVQATLQEKGVQVIIVGAGGPVTAQYPAADTPVLDGSLVFLQTAGDRIVPDFKGWSLRNVVVYKALSNLPIEIVGEGYVESQSISPGTLATADTPLVVQLQTPEEYYRNGSNLVEETDEEQLPQD